MPVPHSTDNYTVPGGIKLFFDDGTGERDLGNVVDLDLETGTEELEHYCNRSGKRMKDKVIVLEEKLMLRFKFDEPVIENLRYYFKGGDISAQSPGTDTNTDLKLALTGELLHSVGQYYGLSNVVVRQFLDKVLLFDGFAYTDNSLEADTLGGTPFAAMQDSGDILYLGKATKFKEAYFDLATNGSYTGIAWEYWDGDSWAALTVSGTGANLSADGAVTFTPPDDWAKTTVNGQSLYWIRVKCTGVTTAATINHIRQNLTVNSDYVLDPGQAGVEGRLPGRIGRLASGKLVDGEEVKVTFDYTIWAALKMTLAARNYIEGAARLEVHPSAGRGLQFDIVIPKAMLKPNGAISLDDKVWLTVPMTLEVLDASTTHPDTPFGYLLSYE